MDLRYNAGEVVTAMITPFDENLKIDYSALEKLVNHLIETGSDTLLIAGTTGESPTLSF
ncbi:MAG: dihydrodipicolinate synthase family protein, partial [Candidatus Gastranaerophilaceae bacterium]